MTIRHQSIANLLKICSVLCAVLGSETLSADESTTAPRCRAQPCRIGRPLSSVTLHESASSESLEGKELQTPYGECEEYFAALPTVEAASPPPVIRCPNRNLWPICHQPLFFEDPNMERCGHGFGIFTEAVSVARFFGRIPMVPATMGATPPCECVRSLPDCPSCHKFGCDAYLPDVNARSMSLQAAAAAGLIFLIP